ncbi:MAG: hypothetical protein AAFZ38_11690 [Myxococcota bacterium]
MLHRTLHLFLLAALSGAPSYASGLEHPAPKPHLEIFENDADTHRQILEATPELHWENRTAGEVTASGCFLAPKAGAPVAGDESLGQQIAGGHAGEKHLDDVGAEDLGDLADAVDGIVNNPDAVKDLSDGRRGYWSDDGVVVIEDPNHPDGGTVFRPDRGRDYFDDL